MYDPIVERVTRPGLPSSREAMREDLPYSIYAPWFDLADRVFERLPMLDLYHVQDQQSG